MSQPFSIEPELRRIIGHLAAIERGSASPGEREAAEWIATEMSALGCEASVEAEHVVGSFYLPIGLLNAATIIGCLRGGRIGRAVGALAAALLFEDVDHRRRLFRRHALPKRATHNVTASAGDREAARTLVVIAHHDAAHGGAIYDTSLIEAFARRFPERHARTKRWPPVMALTLLGPVLAAFGSRRWAAFLSLGAIAVMSDIAVRPVVPGANDNLSAVAVVLALARRLRDEPIEGLHVLLVSTGSEESNSEGMAAWGARHFPRLPRESTTFVALETLGSGHAALAESEGFVVPHPYTGDVKDAIEEAGRSCGVEVWRGLHNAFASDGQIALHAGYPTALLGGLDDLKLPANYHKPTDTADRIDYVALAQALTIVEGYARDLAASSPASRDRAMATAS